MKENPQTLIFLVRNYSYFVLKIPGQCILLGSVVGSPGPTVRQLGGEGQGWRGSKRLGGERTKRRAWGEGVWPAAARRSCARSLTLRASQGQARSTEMRRVGVEIRLRLPSWLGNFLPFWLGKLFNFCEPPSPPRLWGCDAGGWEEQWLRRCLQST